MICPSLTKKHWLFSAEKYADAIITVNGSRTNANRALDRKEQSTLVTYTGSSDREVPGTSTSIRIKCFTQFFDVFRRSHERFHVRCKVCHMLFVIFGGVERSVVADVASTCHAKAQPVDETTIALVLDVPVYHLIEELRDCMC
jgi:hypothetical protein